MKYKFVYDSRLGLQLPHIHEEWGQIEQETQEQILSKWEAIRGAIPDRVKNIEQKIEKVHKELSEEENFERSCELNLQMAELASVINDLWIWFRKTPSITHTFQKHHA